jgi:hypothetical protein
MAVEVSGFTAPPMTWAMEGGDDVAAGRWSASPGSAPQSAVRPVFWEPDRERSQATSFVPQGEEKT